MRGHTGARMHHFHARRRWAPRALRSVSPRLAPPRVAQFEDLQGAHALLYANRAEFQSLYYYRPWMYAPLCVFLCLSALPSLPPRPPTREVASACVLRPVPLTPPATARPAAGGETGKHRTRATSTTRG